MKKAIYVLFALFVGLVLTASTAALVHSLFKPTVLELSSKVYFIRNAEWQHGDYEATVIFRESEAIFDYGTGTKETYAYSIEYRHNRSFLRVNDLLFEVLPIVRSSYRLIPQFGETFSPTVLIEFIP
jgi:hypothetical protein